MAVSINDDRTAYQNIQDLQKQIKRRDFLDNKQFTAQDRMEIYASIFALRLGVGAQRNSPKTLKVKASQKDYQDGLNLLLNNQSFQGFLKAQGEEELRTLFTEGHGGAAEDKFRDYLLQAETLPTDVPGRYMPRARDRLEHLQGKLKNVSPDSPEATHIYSEMFRARRAVGAVRGKKTSLEATVTGRQLSYVPDLEKNAVFQSFVGEKGGELKIAAAKGHGGAAEDLFKNYVLRMDHIPADVPQAYMPDAKARTELIQTRLSSNAYRNGTVDQRLALYAELLGTRESVNAVRGQSSSLEKPVDPVALNEATATWTSSKTLRDYVANHEAEVRRAAAAGHGGALEQQLREHILSLDHLPGDVPPAALPEAMERTEALQKLMKSASYGNRTGAEKLTLYAELMGTRSAVGAKRGEKASLKQPIDLEALNRDVKELTDCQTFRDYIRDHEPEARSAATSGHGGALEDAFKDYVLHLDKLPEDLPAAFFPQALERTESLQSVIKKSNLSGPQNEARRLDLYAELMATREAAGAIRGNRDSLKTGLDRERMNAAREKWTGNEVFRDFIRENEAEAREAALSGHGGALADRFKDYVAHLDQIPENVPEGYLPTALERTEALRDRILGLQDEPELEKNLVAELFATRRSVDPIRGKKDSLDKPIDREKMLNTRDYLLASSTFQDFMDPAKNPDYEKIKDVAAMGHGGAAEDAFSDYVCNQDHIGTDVPEAYLPTGLQRTEALQKKIGSAEFHGMDKERKIGLMAELMATRDSVNAVRGNKRSLDYPVDPSALQESYKEYSENPTFRAFVSTAEANAVSGATRGHGGMLQDKFKEYVCSQTILPDKLPKDCAPSAQQRIEALQKQIKDPSFARKTEAEQKVLYTELAATRMAAEAKRGDKSSLSQPLDLEAVAQARDTLSRSNTFQQFLSNNLEVRSHALSGHGGELEDRFKAYVLDQKQIPGDVPNRYMPTALERTETLQKKLSTDRLDQQEREDLTRELLATRSAVDAQRGQKDSLRETVDSQRLIQERTALERSPTVTDFLRNQNAAELRKAACAGHGGELEDKLRQNVTQRTLQEGTIPEGTPARYQPNAQALYGQLQEDLRQKSQWMNAQDLTTHRDELRREVACMMYLYKWQRENPGREAQGIDPEKMRRGVNALRNSAPFNKMFENPALTQQTLQRASNSVTQVFDTFASNRQAIQAQKQQKRQRFANIEANFQQPEENGIQRRNSMNRPQFQLQI